MNAKLRSVVVIVGWVLCVAASAQQYPNRPIRIVTVGADDAMPRILAAELSGPLGQQVFIEEHAGASGTIGAAVAARAPADGYSFMVATSTHMVTPHFYKLSYDILRDFEPVSLLASTPFVLLSHPSLPVRTLDDLIKLAKAKPGQLNYSATSAGSTSMLTAELFKAGAQVNIVHVPYKSVAAALTDAIAGQVHLTLSVTPSALSQIRAQRVRALAVSTPNRSAVLPDVPTFAEQGLPKVSSPAWFGLVAPAKTAPAFIARMNAEVVTVLRKPAVRERILTLAMEPGENTPEEFRAYMKADLAKWSLAVKDANVPTVTQR
jgi:tripartite-type tricarboxylate transporter receptor subunit TctC